MSRTIPLVQVRWAPLNLLSFIPITPQGDVFTKQHSSADVLVRMHRVLNDWRNAKYASGQRCRGVVADCIGFVFGAIDDLDGRPRAQAANMPADVALHDPATAQQALLALRALYQPVEPVEGPEVEPFDILCVGPRLGGPCHAMLVGPQRNTLWHCTPASGVHQAGWGLGEGYEVLHGAFRIGDRDRWVH